MEDEPIEGETETEAEQYVDTKNIVLPQGLLKVKDEAFYNWRKTKSVSIPPGVAKIGNRAFYCCANLSDLVLPKSVEAIGEEAFAHCMSLRAVHIPDGVTRISKGAFAGCINLKSVHLPSQLEEIEELAFFGCTSLEAIELPLSCKNIERAAFAFCKSLAKLTISPRIQLIDKFAFYACPIEKLVFCGTRALWESFGEHIIHMGNSSLYSADLECSKISGHYDLPVNPSETEVAQQSFPIAFGQRRFVKSITIREGTEVIWGWTFLDCSELELIELPKSLKHLSYNAFYDIWKVSTVVYGGTKAQWRKFIMSRDFGHGNTVLLLATVKCSDGVFEEKGETDLVVPYSSGKSEIKNKEFKHHIELRSVVIEEGITQIGKYAFCACVNLASVTIPKSVAVIERFAFYDCLALEELVIPEGTREIKKGAFNCCSALKSVSLPESLKTYGHYAFTDCDAIESVRYGGTKAQWQELALVNRFKEYSPPLADAEVICKDGTYSRGKLKEAEYEITRAQSEMKKRQKQLRDGEYFWGLSSNSYIKLVVFRSFANWGNEVVKATIDFRIKAGVFPTTIIASDATYTKIVEASEVEKQKGPEDAALVRHRNSAAVIEEATGKEELPPPGEDATEQEVQAWIDSCFAGFDTDISTDEMKKDGFPLLLAGNRLVSPFYSLKMLCSEAMPVRLYQLMCGEPPTDDDGEGEMWTWKTA